MGRRKGMAWVCVGGLWRMAQGRGRPHVDDGTKGNLAGSADSEGLPALCASQGAACTSCNQPAKPRHPAATARGPQRTPTAPRAPPATAPFPLRRLAPRGPPRSPGAAAPRPARRAAPQRGAPADGPQAASEWRTARLGGNTRRRGTVGSVARALCSSSARTMSTFPALTAVCRLVSPP